MTGRSTSVCGPVRFGRRTGTRVWRPSRPGGRFGRFRRALRPVVRPARGPATEGIVWSRQLSRAFRAESLSTTKPVLGGTGILMERRHRTPGSPATAPSTPGPKPKRFTGAGAGMAGGPERRATTPPQRCFARTAHTQNGSTSAPGRDRRPGRRSRPGEPRSSAVAGWEARVYGLPGQPGVLRTVRTGAPSAPAHRVRRGARSAGGPVGRFTCVRVHR